MADGLVHNPLVYGLLIQAGVPTQYVYAVANNAYLLGRVAATHFPLAAALASAGRSLYNYHRNIPPGFGNPPDNLVLDLTGRRPSAYRRADVQTIYLP